MSCCHHSVLTPCRNAAVNLQSTDRASQAFLIMDLCKGVPRPTILVFACLCQETSGSELHHIDVCAGYLRREGADRQGSSNKQTMLWQNGLAMQHASRDRSCCDVGSEQSPVQCVQSLSQVRAGCDGSQLHCRAWSPAENLQSTVTSPLHSAGMYAWLASHEQAPETSI